MIDGKGYDSLGTAIAGFGSLEAITLTASAGNLQVH